MEKQFAFVLRPQLVNPDPGSINTRIRTRGHAFWHARGCTGTNLRGNDPIPDGESRRIIFSPLSGSKSLFLRPILVRKGRCQMRAYHDG